MIHFVVSIQYTSVTDGQTDVHRPTASTALIRIVSRRKNDTRWVIGIYNRQFPRHFCSRTASHMRRQSGRDGRTYRPTVQLYRHSACSLELEQRQIVSCPRRNNGLLAFRLRPSSP